MFFLPTIFNFLKKIMNIFVKKRFTIFRCIPYPCTLAQLLNSFSSERLRIRFLLEFVAMTTFLSQIGGGGIYLQWNVIPTLYTSSSFPEIYYFSQVIDFPFTQFFPPNFPNCFFFYLFSFFSDISLFYSSIIIFPAKKFKNNSFPTHPHPIGREEGGGE